MDKMSKGNDFYLDTPSEEDTRSQLSRQFADSDSDDDLSSLPYPQPLQRSAFLVPDFKAADYLSTLRNRHQTLSDLRVELRTRSQTLAKELLDLVNDEYQAFLGLGGDLRGGEEKVEAVRVGVLGFVKGVEGVKTSVVTRKAEVDTLLQEKRRISSQILVGRQLVEIHTRVGELEEALAITSNKDEVDSDDEDSDDEDSDDEEEGEDGQDVSGVVRLERLVMSYLSVQQIIEQVGKAHPFLVRQEERLKQIRSTLLLDLGNALRQAKDTGTRGKTKLLRMVALYGDMDEAADAIRILKEAKTKTKR
jgi:hypothetical protein